MSERPTPIVDSCVSATPNDVMPAFPQYAMDDNWDFKTGMSLRDWFAGMAMQQFVSERDHNVWAHERFASNRVEIARAAYNIAAAMLAERERKEGVK